MSGRDIAVVAAVVIAFAVLVTAHVLIVAGLLGRRPLWRAPLALLVVPLAPYFALRERMRARGITWLAALVAYVVARVVAAT